ncbi:MAG: cysteine desulfurase NifS [Lachnospiraceae bacterium]|nr:cysteine desulfurase NifS [Lachnospiraceae bacterium]
MIYLDNAATTKTLPEVVEAMLPFFMENYGNPSALYASGIAGKKAVNQARRDVAEVIGAKPEEIYFTSGGTEADNWALTGVVESYRQKGRHIITTKIEHAAILRTCEALERKGVEVTYLDVDEEGVIDLGQLEAAIRPDTILISIMFANNEIGTLEPVAKIGRLARKRGVLFHTDAVQAFGQIPICAEELGVDLLSASAHKLNGPKGVGILYIRTGIKLGASFHGGGQERNRRAGTENVPGIVGFGRAALWALHTMEQRAAAEKRLREYLIERIEAEIPCCRLNGHREKRLPNNVNFSFMQVEGEALLVMLDMKGICASGGSACTSGTANASHVLRAIGLKEDEARGSLRLTPSWENTKEEMDVVVDHLKQIVAKLRRLTSALPSTE